MSTPMKILGGAAVLVGLFAFKKKNDYAAVIEKMTWDIFDIRNLRTGLSGGKWKVFFDLDVTFHNNTKYEFDFDTAGYIYLRKIEVFHNGAPIGEAASNATKIILPPFGHFTVSGIQIEVNILDALNEVASGGLDTDAANYSLKLQIDALGQTFFIDKPLAA
jgi:hypothetical protein